MEQVTYYIEVQKLKTVKIVCYQIDLKLESYKTSKRNFYKNFYGCYSKFA